MRSNTLTGIQKAAISGLCALLLTQPLLAAESNTHRQLEEQLQEIERQINQYEQQLRTLKGQKNSLANKIAQLKLQQQKIAALIQETVLQLERLDEQVNQTNTAIAQNAADIAKIKQSVTNILQTMYEHDQQSLFELLLIRGSLTEVFQEIVSYQAINQGLVATLELLQETKQKLRTRQDEQEQQQAEQQTLLTINTLQNETLQSSLSEQRTLLTITNGKESAYQTIVGESKQEAAKIRSRIYELFSVGKQVSFGEAVTIAEWVSRQTGVRAAFLLAVLTQESNLGKNVGTCNRLGDPPEKSWKAVMKPERDHKPFLAITEELGLDPDLTPVSCPMRDRTGERIGWGGAMGPAQFIPSTWQAYKNKVSAISGKTANPWDIRDAFIAAAVKLKADGASSVEGEWAAAMRYFSGSTNPAFRFYGDNVVALADDYQADIKALE